MAPNILLQKRRDKAAAKRFFKRVLRSSPAPHKIVADQLRSNPAAKAQIPELAHVKHVFVKAAARLNNCAENSHQPTRERERRIPQGDFLRGVRGFRDPERTQKTFSRASGRSVNISRSSGICCALHFIASNSQRDSLHGANSSNSPKIRRLPSDYFSHLPSCRLILAKLTMPLDVKERRKYRCCSLRRSFSAAGHQEDDAFLVTVGLTEYHTV
jgi:putative transposase